MNRDANLDLNRTFTRCFRSPDGQRVLAHLRKMTLERALGPAAPDTLLRHLEGQRQLVAHIENLIARGQHDTGQNDQPQIKEEHDV